MSSTEFSIFGEKNAQVLELSLSSCARSQFSCTNGLCIDLLKRYSLSKMFSKVAIKLPRVDVITFRCDFKNDCPDKSDESGCKKVDSCLTTYWKYFPFSYSIVSSSAYCQSVSGLLSGSVSEHV